MADTHGTIKVTFPCDCTEDCEDVIARQWPVFEARGFAVAVLSACDGLPVSDVRWPSELAGPRGWRWN